ncbi:MAG: C45 family peptidase [Candidatus Omnitrophota bacterium]
MKTATLLAAVLVLALPAWTLEIRVNDNPIYDQAPRLVKEAINARLFAAGEGEDEIRILHLWGAPREMGRAYGAMMKEDIANYTALVLGLMSQEIEGGAEKIDQVYELAKSYIPEEIIEELQGLAEGSGVDFKQLLRVNLIGDASEWHCSLFGAWGAATASTGSLLQLRALDYAVRAEIQKYPLITVYHPEKGHAFANIGWVGMIGVVTGMSSAQMAVSEIGDDYDQANDSFEAMPFVYLLRNIMQYDESLEQAIERMRSTKRNTSLMYAVGDGKKGEARAFQTSHTLCNVYDPQNLEPLTDSHPRIDDIVYWGMSWNVPAFDKPLHDMLVKNYGKLTGETTIHEILPTVRTGNLQVAVYDLTRMILWTANAASKGEAGPLEAYKRAYVKLDMNKVFSEKRPEGKE